MKKIIIILFVFSITAFQAYSLKPASEIELKSVINIAKKAEIQFEKKNYVESMSLYKVAYEQLLQLMQNGIILFSDGNKYLKKWRKKQKKLKPLVTKITYNRLFEKYNLKKKEYLLAEKKHNIHNMNILLSNCEKIYDLLENIKNNSEDSEKFSIPENINDLRNSYNKNLNKVRTKWLKKSDFNDTEKKVIYKIINDNSLKNQNMILENSAENNNRVSLAKLEKIYFELSKQEPTIFKFWYGLGNSCFLQKKIKEANQVWHLSLKFFPDSIYIHYHLARTCENTEIGNKRAVSHLKWILAKTKERDWLIKTHIQLALRFLQLSEIELALTHSKEAEKLAGMDLTPENRKLYSEAKKIQCSVQLRIGNTEAAISSLEDAVQMSPENISLKIELADLLSNLIITSIEPDMKKAKAALLIYDKLIKEYPKKSNLHLNKAKIFLALNNFQEAEKSAILELTVTPRSSNALTFLGLSYLGQGKKDAAKMMFNKALDINPKNSVALENLEKIK